MLTTPLAISDNASTTYFTHRKLTNKWILAPPLTPHARDYRLGYEPYVPIMNRQSTWHALRHSMRVLDTAMRVLDTNA